ncbi:hypothetical protein AB4Z29_23495 [Paenibacillus sp. 2TAB23]|uniref:hypothetical protein n=1 Tax=Paenibacillus sp. 2TAB23 TaxID=3233004 RepID=UPI003F97F573
MAVEAIESVLPNVQVEAFIRRYENAVQLEQCKMTFGGANGKTTTAVGAEWSVRLDTKGDPDRLEGLELTAVFQSTGYSEQTSASLSFRFSEWSEHNYVLVPGAVYNGNRFNVRKLPYAPCWTKLTERGPNIPTTITDVPRLSIERDHASAFHLLTGDAATPAIGAFDEKSGNGWLFITEQATNLGDTSMHMEEDDDRRTAQISFQAPGVRPDRKYEMTTTSVTSTDSGHDFKPGETVVLKTKIYRFPCDSVNGLFEQFAKVRQQGMPSSPLAPSLPLSAAWEVQEQKYNALNWNDQLGYYAVGTIDMKHQDWQIGWVGGGMSSYALLLEGSELSAQRALDTLRFMFSSQTESGFFHGVCYKGQWYGDEFSDAPDRDHPEQWHILRKSADALYFIMKHFIALEQVMPAFVIPESWLAGTRRLADAFVKLWRSYGQFGQWVHSKTGDILVGGSAGAGIAPAGLALFGAYFKDKTYITVAEQAAEYFYLQFTKQGVTTGGPGEILQCPDSESAFALLESYMVLFDESGDQAWLTRAEEAALQCMSWCVSYDFRFPQGSTFDRLGIRTTGSVIANVQNKHSAPGICTLSGDSLFKLYRATGNGLYMELLREIAGNMAQYLSREDRPVRGWDGDDMPAGYMSERVNMSDWEGQAYVGEVIPYSCWCEVSLMLSYAELPGIYVNKKSGDMTVIDQVDCSLEAAGKDGSKLTIHNNTKFPAHIKLLVESEDEAKQPLGPCASVAWKRIAVPAGETLAFIL